MHVLTVAFSYRVAPLGPVRGVRDVRGWPAVILAAVEKASSTSQSTVGSKSTWLRPQVYTITAPGGPPGVPLPLCQADAAGACRRQLSARQSCNFLNININKSNNNYSFVSPDTRRECVRGNTQHS